MLAKIMIYKRENLNLSINELVNLIGITRDEYIVLENPKTNKMSIQMFELLAPILKLDDEFKKKFVTPYYRYGDVLKQKRIEKGLSLGKVEKLTGISAQHIWKLENNVYTRLSYSIFIKLKKVYDIKDETNFEPFFFVSSKVKMHFINDGTFGELVLQKRKRLKFSQKTIASHIKISDTLLSKIESGKVQSISCNTAIKLIDELEFTKEEAGKYLVYQRNK